ncbi:regulatory protein [Fibrella aestuarina BUZ 2]|uniref:Regulatory protein n=1 Tax=Fibrella aestuarina BUZ 2 TaxID=1166018 RepID=I0K8B9_9BACT|nr:Crp/Fnr family transcriptional regulator [Fibrella aestuarina]CCH00372.1 regulatory protein [Fibrella aestuarina BUZ 2]
MHAIIDHLIELCPQAWTRQLLDMGSYVYQPADADARLYLIEKGLVKIGSLGASGERILYDLLQPGELFGDLDYIDDAEFFEFAQAATPLSVLAIDRTAFRRAVRLDPVLADWFQQTLVRRWHRAETRLLHRSSVPVDGRIRFLEEQYSARVTDAHYHLHRPFDLLSLQEVGDLVGATRQTVSRKLKHRLVLAM